MKHIKKYLIIWFIFIFSSFWMVFGVNTINSLTQTVAQWDIMTSAWYNAVYNMIWYTSTEPFPHVNGWQCAYNWIRMICANVSVVNSCATQPSYANATYTVGTPTSVWQAWVQWATNCWYTCTWWYTWSDCSVASILTQYIYVYNRDDYSQCNTAGLCNASRACDTELWAWRTAQSRWPPEHDWVSRTFQCKHNWGDCDVVSFYGNHVDFNDVPYGPCYDRNIFFGGNCWNEMPVWSWPDNSIAKVTCQKQN